MSYTLKKDEVAIIMRPLDYDMQGNWSGDAHTSMIIPEKKDVPEFVLAHLIHIATMMSAFLDLASEDEELMDAVEDRRNELMGYAEEEMEQEEEMYTQEGNVYTLNKWTKTEGSA